MSHKDTLNNFRKLNKQIICVTVLETKGSAPREAGATMLVGISGIHQTIGGGNLEFNSIEQARNMLETGLNEYELEFQLGPDTGQCCGGVVRLGFKRLDNVAADNLLSIQEATQRDLPNVYVFGAGHVGSALVEALLLLPLRVTVIDSRPEQLDQFRTQHRDNGNWLATHLLAIPESIVERAEPNSAFVVMTHDHGQDFSITCAALMREDAAYVGMIGSKTKRGVFKSWLADYNGSADRIDNLVCPIGGQGSTDKRPGIIAALVAAEIVNALFPVQK